MTWIFATFMVASALFDLWMMFRAERLMQERDTAREDLEVMSHLFRRQVGKLTEELKQAREFNQVHSKGGDS